MAPEIQDCWDGNKCMSDEHCGETGGVCSTTLAWSNGNNYNLTDQLQGQVHTSKDLFVSTYVLSM